MPIYNNYIINITKLHSNQFIFMTRIRDKSNNRPFLHIVDYVLIRNQDHFLTIDVFNIFVVYYHPFYVETKLSGDLKFSWIKFNIVFWIFIFICVIFGLVFIRFFWRLNMQDGELVSCFIDQI